MELGNIARCPVLFKGSLKKSGIGPHRGRLTENGARGKFFQRFANRSESARIQAGAALVGYTVNFHLRPTAQSQEKKTPKNAPITCR